MLLHAWAESRRSFNRLLPGLHDYGVYAPDLRVQGVADKPKVGYSMANQAQDAAAVLDALEMQSASVLGSSSGGYLAQQLDAVQPDRVAAALALEGAPFDAPGTDSFHRRRRQPGGSDQR